MDHVLVNVIFYICDSSYNTCKTETSKIMKKRVISAAFEQMHSLDLI